MCVKHMTHCEHTGNGNEYMQFYHTAEEDGQGFPVELEFPCNYRTYSQVSDWSAQHFIDWQHTLSA